MPQKTKVIKQSDAKKIKQALLDLLKEQKQLDAKVKKLDEIIKGASIKHS